ncbi:MAG: hypothetical protein RIQ63_1226 [Actinomycetota bacterium]
MRKDRLECWNSSNQYSVDDPYENHRCAEEWIDRTDHDDADSRPRGERDADRSPRNAERTSSSSLEVHDRCGDAGNQHSETRRSHGDSVDHAYLTSHVGVDSPRCRLRKRTPTCVPSSFGEHLAAVLVEIDQSLVLGTGRPGIAKRVHARGVCWGANRISGQHAEVAADLANAIECERASIAGGRRHRSHL